MLTDYWFAMFRCKMFDANSWQLRFHHRWVMCFPNCASEPVYTRDKSNMTTMFRLQVASPSNVQKFPRKLLLWTIVICLGCSWPLVNIIEHNQTPFAFLLWLYSFGSIRKIAKNGFMRSCSRMINHHWRCCDSAGGSLCCWIFLFLDHLRAFIPGVGAFLEQHLWTAHVEQLLLRQRRPDQAA